MRCCLMLLMVLMMAGCSSLDTPPTLPPPDPQRPQVSLLQIGQGAFDGQTVTVQAPLIQRANGRVFVPALALGNAPQPLVANPLEVVTVGGDALEGLNQASNGETYGVVRITGIVQLQADGVRQIQPSSSKIIEPFALTLPDLQKNNAVYQQQILKLKGTLIVKSDEALLVEAVNEGGIPTETAVQLKIAQPFSDTALIETLPKQNGAIRYGEIELVGELQGKTLRVFWATKP